MAATGDGTCLFAGGDKYRTFACSAPSAWARVEAGLRATRQHSTMVVDCATREHAGFDFSTCGIALLPPDNPPRSVAATAPLAAHTAGGPAAGAADEEGQRRAAAMARCLYEVVEERSIDMRDEEWMYVLEQQAKDPYEVLSGALHTFATGQTELAVRKLRTLLFSAHSPPAALVSVFLPSNVAQSTVHSVAGSGPDPPTVGTVAVGNPLATPPLSRSMSASPNHEQLPPNVALPPHVIRRVTDLLERMERASGGELATA